MTERAGITLGMQRRYELITRVLRHNILSGRLPRGIVLLEGPIAELMQSSRAPVQAALRILEEDGLIHRFSGRGFLAGPPGEVVEPLRKDIRELDLQIAVEIDEALQSRGTWELVYDQVEQQVASCLIFGEFRIVETELGDYLGVSRTVVRDVLSRLHERGLIRKNQSSHWIAGPLTAQTVREKFEVRAIIEPAALRLAAGHIDYRAVEVLSRRLSAGETVDGEHLQDALNENCLMRVPNRELADLIRNNQLLLKAAGSALNRLGLPPDRVAHGEYRTLFDLISRHLVDSAAEYLTSHLRALSDKNLARLKIVAVISESSDLAPYLTPK